MTKLSIVIIILHLALRAYSVDHNETTRTTTPAAPITAKITSTTEFIPIDLFDLGYYDGGWEKFCDRYDIQDEFRYYPEHELKKVRIILCQRIWESRIFSNESMAACALYKYCLTMRPRVDKFIEDFVDKFSFNNTEKKAELVHRGEYNETTPCFQTSQAEFDKKCISREDAYNSMFKQIFARACTFTELTTEVILSTIEEVCRDKFMSGKVNWLPFFATIGFRKE